MQEMSKKVIGRSVVIDLPELKIFGVVAKVDTGAYRSALHCDLIEPIQIEDEEYLRLNVTTLTHESYRGEPSIVRHHKKVRVRSSTGHVQERYVIKTPVLIDGDMHVGEFTLTRRDDMRFPILLGRRLMKGKFLVDVERTHS